MSSDACNWARSCVREEIAAAEGMLLRLVTEEPILTSRCQATSWLTHATPYLDGGLPQNCASFRRSQDRARGAEAVDSTVLRGSSALTASTAATESTGGPKKIEELRIYHMIYAAWACLFSSDDTDESLMTARRCRRGATRCYKVGQSAFMRPRTRRTNKAQGHRNQCHAVLTPSTMPLEAC
eukprot:5718206-Amphidinium_carterae.1